MAEKTVTRGTSGRLTVEVAVKQVTEDCKEIRRDLHLSTMITKPRDLLRIKDESRKIMEAKKRGYFYYEIGFVFFTDHAVMSLRNKIGLTEEEEKLLRAAVGRLYYNAPFRELSRMARAAERIDENRERSTQIFDAWLQEQRDFRAMRKLVNLDSDMFDNPVYALTSGSLNAKNFGDIAVGIRDTIRYNKKLDGYTSFYE